MSFVLFVTYTLPISQVNSFQPREVRSDEDSIFYHCCIVSPFLESPVYRSKCRTETDVVDTLEPVIG